MKTSPAPAGYTPGVCNINPAETAYRRKAGYAGLAITAVVALPLFLLDVNHLFRLVIALPLYLTAISFLQARYRFCVAYAASGMQNAKGDDLTGAKRVSATDRAKDRLKANGMHLQAIAIAIVVAILLAIVPLP